MKSKADITKALDIVKQADLTEEQKVAISQLGAAAHTGIKLRRLYASFVFGPNLASAIINWMSEFKPSATKPLRDWASDESTENVITSWMRFTFMRGLIILLLSSTITVVTAYFLYQQIKKQDELIDVQARVERTQNEFLYLRTLYDVQCVDVDDLSSCSPVHNRRQREVAVKLYLDSFDDVSELRKVRLDGTEFRDASFANIMLEGAVFDNALLYESDFTKAYARHASFEDATIWGTKFRGAVLTGANLKGATAFGNDFAGADLRWSDLENVDLSGSNFSYTKLNQANLTGADISNARGLTCTELTKAVNWELAHRSPELICGTGIPIPPKKQNDQSP